MKRAYFVEKTDRDRFEYGIIDSNGILLDCFCTRTEGLEILDILVNKEKIISYTDGITLFFLIERLPIPYTEEINVEENLYQELHNFRNAVLFEMLDHLAQIEQVKKNKTKEPFLFIYTHPPYFCLFYEKGLHVKSFHSKEQAIEELKGRPEKKRLLRVLNKSRFPKSQITRDFFLQNIDN